MNDTTENSPSSSQKSFDTTWNSNAIISLRVSVYIAIIIVAFFGNALLLVTISFNKKMRNVTNYFLLNLAMGDLMVSITCMPLELIRWFHNVSAKPVLCKTMPFFQATSVGVSVYTLILLAVDRYLAIMLPLGSHFSSKQSAMIISLIWMAAATTASPTLFVMEVRSVQYGNTTKLRCDEFGWSEPKRDASIYTIVLLTLHYFIPLVTMVYIYSRISVFLWFRKIPGADELSVQTRQKLYKKHTKRKRTIKLLVAVLSAFMLCHLPQNVMSIIWYICRNTFKPPYYMRAISFSSEMLLYLNSALNPILYAFLHKKFKESLQWLFTMLFGGRNRKLNSLPTKSRTTTLISLRTRSSCQSSAKTFTSPIRKEKTSLIHIKFVDSPSKETAETQDL